MATDSSCAPIKLYLQEQVAGQIQSAAAACGSQRQGTQALLEAPEEEWRLWEARTPGSSPDPDAATPLWGSACPRPPAPLIHSLAVGLTASGRCLKKHSEQSSGFQRRVRPPFASQAGSRSPQRTRVLLRLSCFLGPPSLAPGCPCQPPLPGEDRSFWSC